MTRCFFRVCVSSEDAPMNATAEGNHHVGARAKCGLVNIPCTEAHSTTSAVLNVRRTQVRNTLPLPTARASTRGGGTPSNIPASHRTVRPPYACAYSRSSSPMLLRTPRLARGGLATRASSAAPAASSSFTSTAATSALPRATLELPNACDAEMQARLVASGAFGAQVTTPPIAPSSLVAPLPRLLSPPGPRVGGT